MLVSYSVPELQAKAFSCPHCGVYARQEWGLIYRNRLDVGNGRLIVTPESKLNGFRATSCENCRGATIWHNDKIIYPFSGASVQPNDDMPPDVRDLFLEARGILFLSPKSATALLRLAIARLFVYLGGKGEATEDDISMLLEQGLQPKVVQALHALRVYGREAVSPGHIDEADDATVAHKLLVFINIICDSQITQPKLIELYSGDNV
jgi:hypothetical protein